MTNPQNRPTPENRPRQPESQRPPSKFPESLPSPDDQLSALPPELQELARLARQESKE